MADTKVSQLPSIGTLDTADVLYVVDDPGGTPASRKTTVGAVLGYGYINLQDQKAQNTDGGTFTSGAWQTRVLNTEVNDSFNLCSLSSNQFTLSAGTYRICAKAPAFYVLRHRARLQNVTDGTTVLLGTSEYSNNINTGGITTSSFITGEFTIAASKALEIQHRCEATDATFGFGVASNLATEIYTVVELWKVG